MDGAAGCAQVAWSIITRGCTQFHFVSAVTTVVHRQMPLGLALSINVQSEIDKSNLGTGRLECWNIGLLI